MVKKIKATITKTYHFCLNRMMGKISKSQMDELGNFKF